MTPDQVADGGEGALDQVEQRLVRRGQLTGRRDLTEVLGDHAGRAVDQVAPAGHELVVGAAHELGPGEVGVLVLGARGGHEVAERVGLVAAEQVADVDHDALAGGELAALHGEELARDDLGGQVELGVRPRLAALVALAGVGEQLRGPDLAVEGDVVLAHEVVGQRLGVVPPTAPRLGVTPLDGTAPGPLDAGREVADHRVEPDVEPLGRVVAPPVQRDRDAPVDVAGHRTRADVLEDVLAELDDVGPPRAAGLALVQPGPERLGQRRQVEEEVLGLDELRRLAVDARARLLQVGGVELVAAVVALVAAGLVVAADRAGALDVAVGQGAPGRGADRAVGGLLEEVPVGVHAGEQLLHDRRVVAGRRAGVEVVGDAERGQVLGDDAVVAVGQLLRRHARLVGGDQDRGPVLVGARDHQHVVAAHPHVAAEHVGGHPETGHVADVAGAVGVGPGDGGQHGAHGGDPRWAGGGGRAGSGLGRRGGR